MPRLECRRPAWMLAIAWLFLSAVLAPALAGETAPRVYVVLWFDTEDYILPASDDAALQVADFLSREKIRATFKIVGEKARTLERRGRSDVITALKRHEIGFHSNYHSVQPTPAMYLSNLGWDEGVAEFLRREGPGRDSVERIFGAAPTCYGQPGSSWGPQSYGAMRKWGMQVYLDAGSHVQLADRPFYYCGILNLYKLAHTLRVRLDSMAALKEAEDRFLSARQKLQKEGGGVVSIYYHPCEFVHKEFWDGANFRNGANPPRENWKLPAAKSAEESKIASEVFESYIRFIKRFDDVQFITASDAAKLYRDAACGRSFSEKDLRTIAGRMADGVTFQRNDDYALTASEIFVLLNEYVASRTTATLKCTPLGPTGSSAPMTEPIKVDGNQVSRSATDVADFVRRQGRIPTTVWLGSAAVSPEAHLMACARLVIQLMDGGAMPDKVVIEPAPLIVARHVADDGANLWGWIIFPRGFRAPQLMQLAKQQSWTIKPAILQRGGTINH